MKKQLNDRMLRGLKPIDGKGFEAIDLQTPNLALRVLESGVKSWTYRYVTADGRARRVTIGRFPQLGVADARDVALEIYRAVRKEGRDPAQEKRQLREGRGGESFGELIERWIDQHALGPEVGPRARSNKPGIPLGALLAPDGKAADIWTYELIEGTPRNRSWKNQRRDLDREVPRSWRRRPAKEISRSEIRALIESKAMTAPVAANRLKAVLSAVFNFGVERELVPFNPVRGIPNPGVERSRDRVLSEDEIRVFWEATEPGEGNDAMSSPMSALWRLRLITAQRKVEVENMRWSEIDGDWWTIPVERSKNGLSHRVPLSDLAIEIIGGLERAGDLVLSGARGKRQQRAASKLVGIKNFRGHDLRRTAASYMASAGVPRHHIGRVLNHSDRSVTAIYDRHSYDAEKRAALDTLANKLRSIIDPGEGAEAVPITAGGRR